VVVAAALPWVSQSDALAKAHFRTVQRSTPVLSSTLIEFFVSAAVAVVLLRFFQASFEALLYGALLGGSASWLYLQTILWREGLIGFTFSSTLWRKSFGYAVGLVPGAVTLWLSTEADRLMLAMFRSREAAGVYHIAFQAAEVVMAFVMAVFMAYGPILYEVLLRDERNIARVRDFHAAYLHLVVGLAVALSLVAPDLFALALAPAYQSGAALVPLLTVAGVLLAFRRTHLALLHYRNATWWVSLTTIVQAFVSVGANLILIPRFGATGATWGRVLGALASAAVVVWLTRSLLPLPTRWDHLRLTGGIALACVAVGVLIGQTGVDPWLALLLKSMVLGVGAYVTWRSPIGTYLRVEWTRTASPES
jgi:O-antigen/teichoic acid export membrane protein